MKHNKTFHSVTIRAKDGKEFIVEGPISRESMETYSFDEELTAFRTPQKQYEALLDVVELPENRLIVARDGDKIIGYAVYLYPDEMERWSEYKKDNLIELGAIEVASSYRGYQLAKHILKVTMMDDAVEDYIIITTEYYWHWDLRGTGLSIWDYRSVMEKVMKSGGLEWFATDDPEICSHPANCLMARIGARVSPDSVHEFDRVRFKSRYMI
ncbi:GNAT family N-acetyltransferase [Paenalkalicoccus suaedae]|uniref:GNAT family N-acetyltransferase n=1 Tax=Paenalkalicoccus suaedae TaxID=2592382 RepID=A0A859FHC7_9BACI|nr:GNAT family N-acetyltransferase [Paenalkalicoccus suaedae]QKS72074.1 GNAT family N-acetyltransferase [Paenalkalicoccus suaedae]